MGEQEQWGAGGVPLRQRNEPSSHGTDGRVWAGPVHSGQVDQGSGYVWGQMGLLWAAEGPLEDGPASHGRHLTTWGWGRGCVGSSSLTQAPSTGRR